MMFCMLLRLCINEKICIYIYIYSHIYLYTYTCIYIYISATALCAFGVTGLVHSAFRLLLFDFLLIGYNRGPPQSARLKLPGIRPPCGPLSEIIVFATSPC